MSLKHQNIHLFTIVYVAKCLSHKIIPSCSINFYPLEVSVRCNSDSYSRDSTLLAFAQKSNISINDPFTPADRDFDIGNRIRKIMCFSFIFSGQLCCRFVNFSVVVDVGIGIA